MLKRNDTLTGLLRIQREERVQPTAKENEEKMVGQV